MTNLNFIPESDKAELIKAAKEYQKIWHEDGERIIETMEKISGLSFDEKEILVIILEGKSTAGLNKESPMRLKASYSLDVKKATLVHEICHRILFGVQSKVQITNLTSHQTLNLILYDVWISLWGKKFANKQVEIEGTRKNKVNDYKTDWEWALSMSREERIKKFKSLIGI